jgi:acyl-CoA thioester hydrolase
MLKHTSTIRVKYADTDAMGIVYNGRYLEYFEVGRTELLRAHGLPYSEVEKAGYQLPLLEAYVKFKTPARYDDEVEIEAVVEKLFAPTIHIDYVLRRKGTDEIIATGYTEHVFIRKDSLKAVRPPKFYTDALKKYFEND